MPRWAREAAFDDLIATAADAYGLDPDLVHGIIAQESGFDARSIGYDGLSYGLMQLRPETASAVRGVPTSPTDLYDPALNLDLGCHYLADQIRRAGTIAGGISAYNGGYRPTMGFGAPPFKNQAYVDQVTAKWRYFASLHPAGPAPVVPPATDQSPGLPTNVKAIALLLAAFVASVLVWLATK